MVFDDRAHPTPRLQSEPLVSPPDCVPAAPAVIDTTKDDVATDDMLRIDVDGVHTTPAAGCIVTLGFE